MKREYLTMTELMKVTYGNGIMIYNYAMYREVKEKLERGEKN